MNSNLGHLCKLLLLIVIVSSCSNSSTNSIATSSATDSVKQSESADSIATGQASASDDKIMDIATYLVNPVSDTALFIEIKSACAIFSEPSMKELDNMKNEMGDEDFYTVEDDEAFYKSEAGNKLDSMNIRQIYTTKRYLKLKKSDNKLIFVDTRAVKDNWPLVLFNPSKGPEIAGVVDLNETELKTYFK